MKTRRSAFFFFVFCQQTSFSRFQLKKLIFFDCLPHYNIYGKLCFKSFVGQQKKKTQKKFAFRFPSFIDRICFVCFLIYKILNSWVDFAILFLIINQELSFFTPPPFKPKLKASVLYFYHNTCHITVVLSLLQTAALLGSSLYFQCLAHNELFKESIHLVMSASEC